MHQPSRDPIPPDSPGPDPRLAARTPWRARLHEIVFEADTPEGRAFDVGLILVIVLSIVTVMLDSVRWISARHAATLRLAEWVFTIIFTIEYVLRLVAVRRPLRYALSFFGLVDLLALLPSYVSLVLPAGRYLLVVRVLRLLRIFRILKLGAFLAEGAVLGGALRASRHKIVVFVATVLTLVVLIGTLMYVIEGEANGFTSIPTSMYWAIVTLTTVGYGDIAPQTPLGKMLASFVMILGFGIIAVPTGIVTTELVRAGRIADPVSTQACPSCGAGSHAADALFCRRCGASLHA